MSDKLIYVTQPYLSPLEEFIPYLENIWPSKTLTSGPMPQRLELALCEYFGVEHIALLNNGTIALLTALQALGVTGEVITTQYSFVTTVTPSWRFSPSGRPSRRQAAPAIIDPRCLRRIE